MVVLLVDGPPHITVELLLGRLQLKLLLHADLRPVFLLDFFVVLKGDLALDPFYLFLLSFLLLALDF